VRLFFPREGQTALRMPAVSNEAWIAQLMLVPRSVRPWVRNLTIRRARPADDEIDIEFALHGDSPMTSWVRRAEPGGPAGIFDIGTVYRLPAAGARAGAAAGRRRDRAARCPLATTLRRHLVNDRGVPRPDISSFDYRRPGRSTPG
jgi:NADPH-dependent ferric siderophore reductase